MSFQPSRVRRSLDRLLAMHPHLDLVSVDWQMEPAGERWPTLAIPGPWVRVELGQPSDSFDEVPAWAVWRFAIWKRTGDVYAEVEGAVGDDPIFRGDSRCNE